MWGGVCPFDHNVNFLPHFTGLLHVHHVPKSELHLPTPGPGGQEPAPRFPTAHPDSRLGGGDHISTPSVRWDREARKLSSEENSHRGHFNLAQNLSL